MAILPVGARIGFCLNLLGVTELVGIVHGFATNPPPQNSNSGGGGGNDNGLPLLPLDAQLERFRVICPADPLCAIQFEGIGVGGDNNSSDGATTAKNIDDNNSNAGKKEADESSGKIWAAVYRSNNNQPSVLVRDELWRSMRLAIDPVVTTTGYSTPENRVASATPTADKSSTTTTTTDESNGKRESQTTPQIETTKSSGLNLAQQKPVAVACLRPSEFYTHCWVLDKLKCVLKKENTDATCDGGSEHTEALSMAIDALLLQYLSSSSSSTLETEDSDEDKNDEMNEKDGQQTRLQEEIEEHATIGARFEGVIRTKGTLVSAALLEERGFVPVDSLQRDMATHLSSLDTCLEQYAQRAIAAARSGAARNRALSIVTFLGQIDRDADLQAAAASSRNHTTGNSKEDNEGKDDGFGGYNPWANVNIL